MNTIRDSLFDDFATSFNEKFNSLVLGLDGSAIALAIAALAHRNPKLKLVIAPTEKRVQQIASDLRFFSANIKELIELQILEFPLWDVEPYDVLSPHAALTIERLRAIFHIHRGTENVIVISTAAALLKKTIPANVLDQCTQYVHVGDTLDRDSFAIDLAQRGYLSTDLVEDAGCFAVRGGVIDVFTPLNANPVRIELFGDEIESIREFDPVSQRSIRQLDTLCVIPAREELLASEPIRRATKRLKSLADSMSCPSHVRRRIVDDLTMGIYFPGIEYMLGVLFDRLWNTLDYAQPSSCHTILVEPTLHHEDVHRYYQALVARFATIDQTERLVPPPDTLFESPETLISDLHQQAVLSIFSTATAHSALSQSQSDTPGRGFDQQYIFRLEPTSGIRERLLAEPSPGDILHPLVQRIAAWKEAGKAVFVACTSNTQARRLRDLLNPHGVVTSEGTLLESVSELGGDFESDGYDLIPLIGGLSSGFQHPAGQIVLMSEADIFGEKVRSTQPSKKFLRNSISSFSQLNRGDPVVHSIHGIGIFRGFRKLELENLVNDFLLIEYQDGDKLYLPVHRLNELQRYVGAGGKPRLDKMGGVTFTKTKQKVRRNVLKMAHELLEVYAAREAQPGFSFNIDRNEMAELEASFPYEETPDQAAAIEAVFQDMAAERPMDRLVCGDVGYGKTEIAVRAAYLAVLNGKQVAILTPTTVLALQHYRTFLQRFAAYPLEIEMLNRFRSAKVQKTILDRLDKGQVDIVIGTHRLISGDIRFHDLGLLIVDEEHRFGVRQKERIKKLKHLVDVLSMSATPIPRTLHMAMSGLREFSLIATPPRDRLSIRTFHLGFSPSKIQEAIRLEIQRGGQVYFVHNRVESIVSIVTFLEKLVPEVSIGMAHGQMSERELEKIMVGFIERKYHVLCCTAIIESGLDIPSVNTIIINRADHFGLAQLYQLRGRVGRSSKRAYCYLMTRSGSTLSLKTQKRLRTLVEFSELGAGLKIAAEDLEMRGAGDILGAAQTGHIASVGMDMYCELLDQAITELRGEHEAERLDPEVDLHLPAFIPEDYMPNFHARLHHYKQLSDSMDIHALRERMEEIEDRFGPYPQELNNLLDLMMIKIELRKLRILNLSFRSNKLAIRFDSSTPIERSQIVSLVAQSPDRYRLTQDQRLIVNLTPEEHSNLTSTVKNLLHNLN